MADPKAEKMEKKLDEAVASKQEGELSETDVEKVSGGVAFDPYKN